MRKLIIAILISVLPLSSLDISGIITTIATSVQEIGQNCIEYLVQCESEVVEETSDYLYTTSELNYRAEPNINSEIYGTLPISTEVYRLGICRNGWSKCLISNIECYVSTDYLTAEKPVIQQLQTYSEYSPDDLMMMGVIYWGGWRFTWYSENVLPGGGLDIPGRWSDGNFVRDCDNYICVASSDLPKGTIIETPWGTAKVYDCGCASGTIDVYTSW